MKDKKVVWDGHGGVQRLRRERVWAGGNAFVLGFLSGVGECVLILVWLAHSN